MKIFYKMTMALVATMMIATSAFAGGPMTNTNQSASFLRSIARGTSLDPDAEDFGMRTIVSSAGALYMNMNAARTTVRARTAELRRLTEADKTVAEELYNAK